MKIAYLYSRFPVVSQTFCLTEMLALERQGVSLVVASLHPPSAGLRHGAQADLQAPVLYAPPQPVLKVWEELAKADGTWPAELVKRHDEAYGPECKAGLRARNALFFADRFRRLGIEHFHVHFVNRAAHTALFLKKLSGIPFSITAHAQDYQTQLGSNHALLREMCAEAKFVVAVSDYSRKVLADICPEATIYHVYNGIDPSRFGTGSVAPANSVPKILSIGRLLEMKGFQVLIAACARLAERGIPFECEIVGEGPMQAALEESIAKHGLAGKVRLAGVLSQEEVARALAACDVFALACVEEADGACDVLPTVILEAMAAGRPVVSTRLAAIPEMVQHGQSGLLAPPGDEKELAEALLLLLRDGDLRRQYGLAARRKLEAVFRVEKTSAQLRALFEKYVTPGMPELETPTASAYLLEQWSADLLRKRDPSLRIFAFKAVKPFGAAVRQIEYLPEQIVLDAEWQQEREWVARIEGWRHELGSALSPAVYEEQARHALWLRKENLRHVHAVGSKALLAAWILRKIRGVTLSATLEETPALPRECLEILLKECSRETKPTFLQKLGLGPRPAGSHKPE